MRNRVLWSLSAVAVVLVALQTALSKGPPSSQPTSRPAPRQKEQAPFAPVVTHSNAALKELIRYGTVKADDADLIKKATDAARQADEDLANYYKSRKTDLPENNELLITAGSISIIGKLITQPVPTAKHDTKQAEFVPYGFSTEKFTVTYFVNRVRSVEAHPMQPGVFYLTTPDRAQLMGHPVQ